MLYVIALGVVIAMLGWAFFIRGQKKLGWPLPHYLGRRPRNIASRRQLMWESLLTTFLITLGVVGFIALLVEINLK